MANHFTTIGFPILTEDDLWEYAQMAMDNGAAVEAEETYAPRIANAQCEVHERVRAASRTLTGFRFRCQTARPSPPRARKTRTR